MTVLGWIFLAVSLAFVCSLTAWCYWRVLTLPVERERDAGESSGDFPGT